MKGMLERIIEKHDQKIIELARRLERLERQNEMLQAENERLLKRNIELSAKQLPKAG